MTPNSTESGSWVDLLSGQNLLMSIMLTAGVCINSINAYMSTTMLPSIAKDIGGIELYSWNTTLFMLAGILSSALTGVVLQRCGARVSYMLAGSAFFTGSLIVAMAPSMTVMLFGRVLQGVGGGMIFALCYSMIMLVFSRQLWPRAMALLSGVFGIGVLAGPAVGGVFAELDVWRLGFGAFLPVTLVYLVAIARLLPEVDIQRKEDISIPLPQLLLIVVSVLSISISGTMTSTLWSVSGIVASVMCVLLLARCDKICSSRLFPKGTFQIGTTLSVAFCAMFLMIVCISSEIYLPYYLQVLYGQSPLIAGYMTASMAVGWTVSELVAARWTASAMFRAINTGPVLMVLGTGGLVALLPFYQSRDVSLSYGIGVCLILCGIGIGLGWPHISTFVLKYTSSEDKANAGSAITTVQMFAVAFGSALAGMIVNATGINGPDGLDGIANSARWLFGVFSIIAMLAFFVVLRIPSTLRGQDIQ